MNPRSEVNRVNFFSLVWGSGGLCSNISYFWCMDGTNDVNPQAHVLGGEIRSFRGSAGLTQRALAARVGKSHSVIVRWERGSRVPPVEGVHDLSRALELSAADRERLVQLARAAADEPANEVSSGPDEKADALTTLIDFERSATAIVDVGSLLVPGLMQTTDYARAVIGESKDADTKAAIRVGRREIITRRRNPVEYTAYVHESALYQQVGRDLMVDQLGMIHELAQLPNVNVRVVTTKAGITWAHLGAFVLLEFARAAPIVHVETLSTASFLRDQNDVDRHQEARASLDQTAMNPGESIQFIADILKRLETT